jgi:hypothetical protein
MKNISNVREKTKTRILYSVPFFFENRAVYEIPGKYCRAGQARNNNMAHVRRMLDA